MSEFTAQPNTDSFRRMVLEGTMTIYNAAEIKAQLLGGLQSASILEIDLSHISEMDTAGFQLLVMAKRESQRLGRTMRIVAHSPEAHEVIDFYNMDAFFGDPVLIPADH
ncbi:MAG: STAS domain-containing protein [Rhodocyclaceae bacterium]|nr:STAS domain-containing protein [Rhodocyclaceae bacterium]